MDEKQGNIRYCYTISVLGAEPFEKRFIKTGPAGRNRRGRNTVRQDRTKTANYCVGPIPAAAS